MEGDRVVTLGHVLTGEEQVGDAVPEAPWLSIQTHLHASRRINGVAVPGAPWLRDQMSPKCVRTVTTPVHKRFEP